MSYTSKYVKYIKDLDLGSRPKHFTFLTSSVRTTNIMTWLKHRSSLDIIDTSCENAFDCLYLGLRSWKSDIRQWLIVIYIPSNDFSHI